MRTFNQEYLDRILKFVNKHYHDNLVAPTISEVSEGVGPRSTTHRYLQELSDRGLLDYGRGIQSVQRAPNENSLYLRPVGRLHSMRLP